MLIPDWQNNGIRIDFKEFVKVFTKKYDGRLDALVNNAGIMACPFGKIKDGFEMQTGCNHLAHFYLMESLMLLLVKTAKTTGKLSCFVALPSMAALAKALGTGRFARIYFDNLNWGNT
jgi:NAD(P)-dependent dehydrogenase (short-subunit alcohol dehydrogenase family)